MDYNSMMNVLTESYSDDTVNKLINILNFKSVDDLIHKHFQAYKLADIYDIFLLMLRFKILHGGQCNFCTKSSNDGDEIDGPCSCGIFERNKIRLQQHLEMFEDLNASEKIKKFYLDRNAL